MLNEILIALFSVLVTLVVVYKIFISKKVHGPGVFEVAAILGARYEKTHQCFYYWFRRWNYEHKVDIPIWGTNKAILLTEPSGINTVLKFPSFVKNRVQFFQPILGNSIGVTNDKDDWAMRKKIATKYFSTNRVKQMLPLLAEEISVFMGKITPGKPFPILGNMSLLTTNLVSRFLFDYDYQLQQGKNSEMLPLMRDLVNRCLFRLLVIIPYHKYIPFLNRTFLANRLKLREFFSRVVDERIVERQTPGYQKKDDLLEAFMDAEIDRVSLFGEICASLWPGVSHAGPLSFWLYEIAKSPDIQKRIQEELDTIMTKDQTVPSWDDLTKMSYTTQVIMEGLRRFPLYPIVTRSTVDGCTFGGETFPKNAEFYTCPYVINNNPKYWTDPWKFDPERFGPKGEGKGNESLLTFNIGNRPCLAAHFVTAESKMLISMLLHKFDMSVDTKRPLQENIFVTLIPNREFHIVFTPRS